MDKLIKDQVITENYALYESDCNYVLPTLPDNSIDLSCYSPPFRGLFHYSSSESDLSNCESPEQFLEHYEYVVMELARVTKNGRINAVHCTDIINQNGSNFDFPHEIIELHEKHGFDYKNRITIWKEPLKVRMRTMVKSLMHKLIVEDATECFTAAPDYVLIFKKRGTNEVPVTHPFGLMGEYAGETPFLKDHTETYGDYELFRKKWLAFKGDVRGNKLSHITWQRYASSVWDDIRINNILKYNDDHEEDGEKHLHPLQLDVIDRLVELYTNPNETVLTPFMGVGSEVYSPVSLGRKAIGIELKSEYFTQAVANLKTCEQRFKKVTQELAFT